MHNAEHIGSAGPANTNSGEETSVVRSGKSVRYTNLVRFGRTEFGLNALVIPGDSITLYGVNFNHISGPQKIDVSFSVGDVAEYGGFNLTYTGTIVSIGEKTVTVRDGSTTRRLAIEQFAGMNKDFNLEKIQSRNAAWMD